MIKRFKLKGLSWFAASAMTAVFAMACNKVEDAAKVAGDKVEEAVEAVTGDKAEAGDKAATKGASDSISDSTIVNIIEFSDFQCPFCARVTPTLTQIEKEYGDKVQVTFMHQPLSFHKFAHDAAVASEAARRQGKFWEYHDRLFANQQKLSKADLKAHAEAIGLDIAQYEKDIADEAIKTKVDRDQAIANAVGATGTPAFFINGQNLRGAQPFEQFKQVIDAEIAAADGKKGEAYVKDRLKTNNAALYGYIYEGKTPEAPKPQKPPVDKTVYKVTVDPAVDAILGDVNAPVTLVTFSEFQCPFCKKVHPTLEEIMKEYEGKARLVFKHTPLPFHNQALPASLASLCAKEQGKFWEYHDLLWENQPKFSNEDLASYATTLSLDLDQFNACFSSKKYQNVIDADMALAEKVTARGTPNTYINGRKIVGARPLEDFKELIDEELKKAEAIIARGVDADKVYDEVIKNGKVFEPLEEKVNTFNFDGAATDGSSSAKIQVVAYSDFECPFCSRIVAPLKDLKAKYGDDVAITFKHFPLSFHKQAMPAAIAATCAQDQGKFWEFHDLTFDNQKALSDAKFNEFADKLGLDKAKFDSCVKDQTHKSRIEADMAEGQKAGVRGTPTLFINGRKFTPSGGYSVQSFASVIDKNILN